MALNDGSRPAVRCCGPELRFPLDDPRLRRRGFSLGNVSRLLERNGERCVRQRIVRRKRRQRQSRSDRWLQLSSIAQRSNQPVMSLEMIRISRDGGPKGHNGQGGKAPSKLIHPALAEFLGGCIRFTHDIH